MLFCSFQNFQHQYQVTEPSSDHMIREPIPMPSGDQTIYAPSANQAVPVYKLSPSYDVFNQQPTDIKPIPISLDFINGPNQVLSNTVPQQQLPDTYALPISNQVIDRNGTMNCSILVNAFVPFSFHSHNFNSICCNSSR